MFSESLDGADDDWASWYADWLINLSELPALLKKKPVRSELVYRLVALDKQYTSESPDEPWESYYASRLLDTSAHTPADAAPCPCSERLARLSGVRRRARVAEGDVGPDGRVVLICGTDRRGARSPPPRGLLLRVAGQVGRR